MRRLIDHVVIVYGEVVVEQDGVALFPQLVKSHCIFVHDCARRLLENGASASSLEAQIAQSGTSVGYLRLLLLTRSHLDRLWHWLLLFAFLLLTRPPLHPFIVVLLQVIEVYRLFLRNATARRTHQLH